MLRTRERSSRSRSNAGQSLNGLLVLLHGSRNRLLVGLGHLVGLQVILVGEDGLLVRALGVGGVALGRGGSRHGRSDNRGG